MKKALITGVSGQDGSYLAELLLRLGYQVYGLVRLMVESDVQLRGGVLSCALAAKA